MTVQKRRKSGRFISSRTHGHGSKKQRGAGNRGGRGKAGTGKRADQKKPSILKEYKNTYFGKKGFKRPQKMVKQIKTINIGQLPPQETLNLKDYGYDKLLSQGTPQLKYKITVQQCSKAAKEKIEKAGGQVLTP